MAVSGTRAHEALFGDDDGHRLVEHLDLDRRALRLLDQRAAGVAVLLRVILDLARDLLAQRAVGAEQLAQAGFLLALLGEFLLDPDALEPRQLSQPDLEDVFGLALGQLERLDQVRPSVRRNCGSA